MIKEEATKEYFNEIWKGFQVLYAQCPTCGRFTKDNQFVMNGLEVVVKGEGICKIHGKVDILNSSEWGWY